MKIAIIQLDIAWEDKEENYRRAERFLKRAAEESCDLAVLPEMFNTGFSMAPERIGETIAGETDDILSGMAKAFGINLIAGYPVFDAGRGMGANIGAAYSSKGEIISKYQKIHPFSFAGEDQHYNGGDGPVVFDICGIPASLFICYDLRFPEIFRVVAPKVKLIFAIANWPAVRKEHWDTLLKARSIENQCYVVGVNRTGSDGNQLIYPGASHVFDPYGNEICCGDDQQEYLVCDIDPGETGRIREQFPFLKDMQDLSWRKR